MNTFERIKEIICEQTEVDPELLKEETTLEEIGADSIDIIEILMALEYAFDIDISDTEAEEIKNIGELSRMIEEKI